MGQIVAAGLRRQWGASTWLPRRSSPPLGRLVGVSPERRGTGPREVDVVIDFSGSTSARGDHLGARPSRSRSWSAPPGWAATSWSRSACGRRGERHVLIAANFLDRGRPRRAIRRGRRSLFERVEIVEFHHDGKIDAPSGTSIATAHAIAESRTRAGLGPGPTAPSASPSRTRAGRRGPEECGSTRSTAGARRAPGSHLRAGRGGSSIRHDSYAARSFVAGVALAVRRVRDRPGLTLGLDALV